MKAQSGNVLGTLFSLFLVFLVFAIGALVSVRFLGVLPHNNAGYTVANTIYNSVFGFFDKSFVFIAFIALFVDVAVSAINPSVIKGITNLLMIFGVAFIGLVLYTNLATVGSVLSANTILPQSYAFLSSNYLVPLIFIFLAICTVLNFRTKKSNENNAENGEVSE